MSKKLTGEQLENAKKAQEEAKQLLGDKKAFEDAFEQVFKEYDDNKDGQIDTLEYMTFRQNMLTKAGRKAYNFPNILMNFERADKDRSGNIDKVEYKKEFTKRLREFVNTRLD